MFLSSTCISLRSFKSSAPSGSSKRRTLGLRVLDNGTLNLRGGNYTRTVDREITNLRRGGVVVVERDLRAVGIGNDRQLRRPPAHGYGKRLRVAGNDPKLAFLLFVPLELEDERRISLGDAVDSARRRSPDDSVDLDSGAGGLGNAFHDTRIEHELFGDGERFAAVESDVDALRLVSYALEAQRVRFLIKDMLLV